MPRATASPRRRVERGPAAALVAVTSLTSCRADQVGTAAIVDRDSISVHELQDETTDFLEVVSSGNAGDAEHAILQQMIVSTLIQMAADSVGVTVSAGEVASQRDRAFDAVREPAAAAFAPARGYLSRQLAEGQSAAMVPPDQIEQFIRDELLASKLGENGPGTNEAVTAAAADTDVEVHPRYGQWDLQQGLVPLIRAGLSSTVEELAGS